MRAHLVTKPVVCLSAEPTYEAMKTFKCSTEQTKWDVECSGYWPTCQKSYVSYKGCVGTCNALGDRCAGVTLGRRLRFHDGGEAERKGLVGEGVEQSQGKLLDRLLVACKGAQQ